MRQIIVDAILKKYKEYGPANQEHVVRESLKFIVNDMSLVCLAQEIGIDTDALLNPEGHRHNLTQTCPTCEVRS